jgi:hypothetical protein
MPKLKRLEPGKWYFAVDCAGCGEPIPFMEAPSPEEKPDPLQSKGVANLQCRRCGHTGSYAGLLISRRPGPEKKQSAPHDADRPKSNT